MAKYEVKGAAVVKIKLHIFLTINKEFQNTPIILKTKRFLFP